MPGPSSQQRTPAMNLVRMEGFDTLPPEIQELVKRAATRGDVTGAQWGSVLASARDKGLIGPDSPWWMGLLAMGAVIAGGYLAGGFSAAPAAGGVAGGSAGGSAAASTGATAADAGAVLPSTSTVGLGTLPAGGSSLTAAGGSAAAASGPSLWSRIAGPVVQQGIPAATNLVGTKMQISANERAAQIAADAAQKALDWQKQQYETRQRQLAPSIGVGQGATYRLGDLMGIPAPAGGYQPPASALANPPAQAAQPRVPPPAPAAPATGQPQQAVQLRAPTGAVSMVPAEQVDYYLQRGATRV